MRPVKPNLSGETDPFRARLDQIINMRHELVRLAKRSAIMAGRYIHAKQFHRARRELKFLRTRLGRSINIGITASL
jgi:hypothetical protein